MSRFRQDFLAFALARDVLRFGRFVTKAGRNTPYFFNAGLFNAGESLRRPLIDEQPSALALPPGVSLSDLQTADVERVIDGDTIDVTIDGTLWRVRYFGVDTPERGDRCFREATDRNTQLIGEEVLLLPDQRDEDEFGRLLRYVFTADGTSVDATLVAEGFGYAWTRDGRYKEAIISLEDDAEAAGRGCLWK